MADEQRITLAVLDVKLEYLIKKVDAICLAQERYEDRLRALERDSSRMMALSGLGGGGLVGIIAIVGRLLSLW